MEPKTDETKMMLHQIEREMEKSNRMMRLIAFLLSVLIVGAAFLLMFGDHDTARASHALFTSKLRGIWI